MQVPSNSQHSFSNLAVKTEIWTSGYHVIYSLANISFVALSIATSISISMTCISVRGAYSCYDPFKHSLRLKELHMNIFIWLELDNVPGYKPPNVC